MNTNALKGIAGLIIGGLAGCILFCLAGIAFAWLVASLPGKDIFALVESYTGVAMPIGSIIGGILGLKKGIKMKWNDSRTIE